MGKKSWLCTVFTQVCLCIALYVALNLGRSQEHRDYTKSVIRSSGGFLDSYFVTVRGGFRAPNEQTRLLRLLEKVSRTYGAAFVVNISELGEDDPLMQNVRGTQKYQSLKIPWYTTKASKGGRSYFREQMKIPHGKTLDLIGLDTGLFKGSVMMGSSMGLGVEQLKWLTKILEETTGEWRIIAGFLPLTSCQESKDLFEARADLNPLSSIFSTYGVNAYLSKRAGMHRVHEGGVTYIGDPGQLYKKSNSASSHGTASVFCRELADGFLLHRVTALEIVTYFVNLSGEAVHKTVLRHPGKEVM
ncbi:uncharacterized protein LOC115752603 isoform X2 [Rhodamnia argentea]|uniref:Uncharacterized protein LOC115752603 isoform X2 n=1 Tax=Rhodamnia argentea TaxID=178133 RepID=A0ABM3H9R2_9MYRT|nr:uncharacterized protein LOC115752603 isoform X2 [Rhodamnia argentea]